VSTLPESQTDNAYKQLRLGILRGDLQPGDRLRAADLQERFGLGLTPIREALTRLSGEGLVEAESHRGSRVSRVSLEELADLLEVRMDVEASCLRRSIARGDAAWEAEIIAAMHLLSKAPLPTGLHDRDVVVEWETCHRRFHFALVAACGSQWLLRFWNILTDQSERYRSIRLFRHAKSEAAVRDINGEHRAIMEAVLARDPNRAIELMREHLEATSTAVKNLMMTMESDA
jgi:DNA-binding GntR family transcriptional regulator